MAISKQGGGVRVGGGKNSDNPSSEFLFFPSIFFFLVKSSINSETFQL